MINGLYALFGALGLREKQYWFTTVLLTSIRLDDSIFSTFWCIPHFFTGSVISYINGKFRLSAGKVAMEIILLYLLGRPWVAILLLGNLLYLLQNDERYQKANLFFSRRPVQILLLAVFFFAIKRPESNLTFLIDGLASVLVLHIVGSSVLLQRLLGIRPLAWLGKYSLGIYILHPILYATLGPGLFEAFSFMQGKFAFLLSFAICVTVVSALSIPAVHLIGEMTKVVSSVLIGLKDKLLQGTGYGYPASEELNAPSGKEVPTPAVSGRLTRKQIAYLLAMLALFCFLFTTLSYRQAIPYEGYPSDLGNHIEFAQKGVGYSTLFAVMNLLFQLFSDPGITAAVLICLMMIATWFLAARFIHKRFSLRLFDSYILSGGLLFLCSIYLPEISPLFYRQGIVSQPWHNITYMGMRLFAILTIYWFSDMIGRYNERFTWKDWLKIAVPLVLSTNIKPSFLISFSITLLILLLVDFVSDIRGRSLTLPRFMRYILMGTTVFPSLAVLYSQSQILYGNARLAENPNGIELIFLGTGFLKNAETVVVVFKFIRALAFPALVWLCDRRSRNREYSFLFLMEAVTLLVAMSLQETGPRANDGNFSWGVFLSGYLLFLYAVPYFVKSAAQTPWKDADGKRMFYIFFGSCLLLGHLLSGATYFLRIFGGSTYFI